MSDSKTCTPQEVNRFRQEGKPIALIDVRSPAEFREVHAVGAVNIPLQDVSPETVKRQMNGNGTEVYVICKTGSRSQMACKQLADAGLDRVVTVEGGTEAWEAAGLEVEHGKKAVSIERQVRILAGFLVLAGTLLGVFVNPYFLILPGFIGAGLMFAGITDTCGMGMMLARMPWNQ